jgi:hypothetical protein
MPGLTIAAVRHYQASWAPLNGTFARTGTLAEAPDESARVRPSAVTASESA